MEQPPPDNLDDAYIEKMNLMDMMTRTDCGVTFLQWLHRLTGFGKPIMSLEDAARRDIWISIRRFIPVERLGEIEHQDLREQQSTVKAIINEIMAAGAIQQEIEND